MSLLLELYGCDVSEPAGTLMPIEDSILETLEQPAAVRRALERNADVFDQIFADTKDMWRIEKIIAIGSGDSWLVGKAIKTAFDRLTTIPFIPSQAGDFIDSDFYIADRNALIFAISSSGREGVAHSMLSMALNTQGLTIGVTDADSPKNPFIAHTPHQIIPGAKKRGMPTQTTAASMATLFDFAINLGVARNRISQREAGEKHAQLFRIVDTMSALTEHARVWARNIAEIIPLDDPALPLVFAGQAVHFPVAQMGQNLIAAGPQLPAKAFKPEELSDHALNLYGIQQLQPVVLIGDYHEAFVRRAAGMVCERSALPIFIGSHGKRLNLPDELIFEIPDLKIDYPFLPLLELVPLQQLSIALAARRLREGHTRLTWDRYIDGAAP